MAKRIFGVALALLLLAGCSFASSPERVTATFLDKLVQGDLSAAEKHTLEGSLGLDKKDKEAAALWKPLFASIQYSAGGAVVDGDYATVNVTLLVADLDSLMAEASKEVTRQVLLGGATGDDLYYKLLLEKLGAEDLPLETFSVSVYLAKDGKWKIDLAASSDFAEALGGGVDGLITG